jgi:hypothetical protein
VGQCVARQRGFNGERMPLDGSPDIFSHTLELRAVRFDGELNSQNDEEIRPGAHIAAPG